MNVLAQGEGFARWTGTDFTRVTILTGTVPSATHVVRGAGRLFPVRSGDAARLTDGLWRAERGAGRSAPALLGKVQKLSRDLGAALDAFVVPDSAVVLFGPIDADFFVTIATADRRITFNLSLSEADAGWHYVSRDSVGGQWQFGSFSSESLSVILALCFPRRPMRQSSSQTRFYAVCGTRDR